MKFVRIEKTPLVETWSNVEFSQRLYFDIENKTIGFSYIGNNIEFTISELISIIGKAQIMFNEVLIPDEYIKNEVNIFIKGE